MKIQLDVSDIKNFFCNMAQTYLRALKRAWRYSLKHWTKSLIVLTVFIILTIFVSLTAAFFWSFFLAFLIMRLDSRVPIAFALACLIVCPFLLIFHYQLYAEQFAIWAYYFLVIGVILQIVEFVHESEKVEEKPKEMPAIDKGKVHRVSEGVFLTPTEKKTIEKKPKPTLRIVLIIIGIIVGVVIFTGGGIILVNRYTLSQEKGVVSEAPQIEKEAFKPVVPSSQIDKTAISITVLNGNGIPGSAAAFKKKLEEQGFKVSTISDADRDDYPETIIRYQPGSKQNAELIANALKENYTIRLEETSVSQNTEIVVIVGQK
jgi:hypothetical protein